MILGKILKANIRLAEFMKQKFATSLITVVLPNLSKVLKSLIHLSELDWTSKNVHPSKVVSLEEDIKVMILDIDNEKRRISLGLKQTKPNPWIEFDNKYNLGDAVDGEIKSVTDFGIFVGLEGNIDGLIHLSDLSEETKMIKKFWSSLIKEIRLNVLFLALMQTENEFL